MGGWGAIQGCAKKEGVVLTDNIKCELFFPVNVEGVFYCIYHLKGERSEASFFWQTGRKSRHADVEIALKV